MRNVHVSVESALCKESIKYWHFYSWKHTCKNNVCKKKKEPGYSKEQQNLFASRISHTSTICFGVLVRYNKRSMTKYAKQRTQECAKVHSSKLKKYICNAQNRVQHKPDGLTVNYKLL